MDRSFIVKYYDYWRIVFYNLLLLNPALSLEFLFILFSAFIVSPGSYRILTWFRAAYFEKQNLTSPIRFI
ncbi:hypothetical protein METBIDRAFT_96958 [Metschnikowia bicuspidata var. bicuspidata NRRL YB-4993]|uniref:Uncharacterized protein n=1 Tax=Metschnikowia bicuspidata var. bicuspidata NRRL YB-4993 TaxID=869754 RepID=A0A1A0HGN7_9ASCO|nr:hypothetical protein METBIDRAFT_96958 [Metschnikowia bicuspidata var. bicuspidata NRRL YB-4993]OBA23042.1 hypothetical protein METBIDRAFT_96958 [Metschnikowia bicuspidata var. bicuspidata NRRL YB-4993]